MGDRMTRGFGAAAIVLTGCLAGCLVSGTADAGVARAAPASATVRAAVAAGTAAAQCDPALDTYNRAKLCWRVAATVAVLQGTTGVTRAVAIGPNASRSAPCRSRAARPA